MTLINFIRVTLNPSSLTEVPVVNEKYAIKSIDHKYRKNLKTIEMLKNNKNYSSALNLNAGFFGGSSAKAN